MELELGKVSYPYSPTIPLYPNAPLPPAPPTRMDHGFAYVAALERIAAALEQIALALLDGSAKEPAVPNGGRHQKK